MNVEDCERILHQTAQVKIPPELRAGEEQESFDYETKETVTKVEPLSITAKIDKLESYLLLTAEARADCSEARLTIQHSCKLLRKQWRELEGWEEYMNGTPIEKATTPQIDRAKATLDEDLYESIVTAEWLEARLTEQIKRLQHDDDVASRVYTLLTGG